VKRTESSRSRRRWKRNAEREKTPTWIKAALLILLMYISMAYLRYRLIHPELTESELLYHLPEAITWSD
jgi:type VI protein secretion system component VasF